MHVLSKNPKLKCAITINYQSFLTGDTLACLHFSFPLFADTPEWQKTGHTNMQCEVDNVVAGSNKKKIQDSDFSSTSPLFLFC